ncbi:MAG: mandelate racemase/muconate lactonizing enzyme family protein [Burkholderiales bacterium]|nr:mandelate racemase/muconate lactonizing enzyme family protein [Burkholderiales bacterium]
MKITGAVCHLVRLPADEPLAGGPQVPGAVREIVTLELRTDAGIEGVGITFFGAALSRSLRAAVEDLAAIAQGEDPLNIEGVIKKLQNAAGSSGPGGIVQLALSAIDIALWDIKGKALDLPVWTLAGGYRPRVPTYASGALMRTFPLEHIVRAGPMLKVRGFRQMKTQLGGNARPEQEVERIKLMREAIGFDTDLMCDINQIWSVHQAIDIGTRIEPMRLFWLEDVSAHDDYRGLARVTEALSTPIAGGEYVYGSVPFRHMLEAGSVDIVMIDLVRAGGVTGLLKIAGMAQAFNRPVVSHLVPEFQVHLIAAIPNGLTVEYMPWSAPLWEEVPTVDKASGDLVVPQRPGFGLKFDQKVLKKYSA